MFPFAWSTLLAGLLLLGLAPPLASNVPLSVEQMPDQHTGETFDLILRAVPGNGRTSESFDVRRLQVTGGAITGAHPVADTDDLWRIQIKPDGRRSVGIDLLAAEPTQIVVPGPPITARVLDPPAYHSGLRRVPIRIEFSEPIFNGVRNLSDHVLNTNGTPLVGVRRIDARHDLWEIIVAPDSGDDIVITLDPTQACPDDQAHCLDDLSRLSHVLEATIPAATLHLTFDDGPHPVYTPQILDLLAEYDARATFFVVGAMVETYPQLIQRIVREGHTLANHTWNHDVLAGLTQEEFNETVTRAQIALGQHATPCLRPPNFKVDEHTEPWAAELGLRLVMATAVTDDWRLPGANVIASRIFVGAAPDAVIVLHDGGGDRSQTVEGLRTALRSLRRSNYSYEPICHPQQ